MEYLVRFAQAHVSFRVAELQALSELINAQLEILECRDDSPFCIVRLPSEEAAIALVSRSILSTGVYELWGRGTNYASLHQDVEARMAVILPRYRNMSFYFYFDSFRGKKSSSVQRKIIEDFNWLRLEGPICSKDAKLRLYLFEWYRLYVPEPDETFFGRWIGSSGRHAINTFDLKKRCYISTTSMDAELALVTANIALASPAKIFYDPFMGSGGFTIACANFGAVAVGSDIDGRSIRGQKDQNVVANFEQYGLLELHLDDFVADLTNTPVRISRFLDGIICDPPYGVREGLRVLGKKNEKVRERVYNEGKPAHLRDGFIPPKKPYSFEAMMDDILDFAAFTLVDNARLALWMPTANDDDVKLALPTHPYLELLSSCKQPFNKCMLFLEYNGPNFGKEIVITFTINILTRKSGSRQLLTFRRMSDANLPASAVLEWKRRAYGTGSDANELNTFRRKYFQGFKD